MENTAIRLYEGYYSDFIEKTPYMILVADENGLLFHVNEAWKHALGYQMDDDMNHTLWHFVHPYSRSLCQDNFSLAKQGDSFDLEVVFVAFDRSLVYTEGKFNCTYDTVNQTKIITGIVQDVTIQNQQALEIQNIKYHFEEKNKYWDMLQKAYASLINEESKHFDENIVSVLKLFGRTVYADRAYIIEFSLNEKASNMTFEWCNRGIAPKKDHFVSIPFTEMEDWVEAHINGDNFYVQDVLSLPKGSPLRALLEPQNVMSMIAVPMMKDGKCYGCVGFDSVKVHRTDAEMEIQILSDLGTLFLYAIKRRKKFIDLYEKERRYQSYLKNIPIAIAICDEKGTIHEANIAACSITGYTEKALIGKKIKTLFAEDLTDHLIDCFHQNHNTQFASAIVTISGDVLQGTVSLSKANACEAILLFTLNKS